MPGLVPGIHVFAQRNKNDVDGRDKPGRDGNRIILNLLRVYASAAFRSKPGSAACSGSIDPLMARMRRPNI